MSKELKIFESEEFGELGVIDVQGKIMFRASEVASMLGYARPADAITAHCKGSVKYRVPTSGGVQEVKFITEGDLYRLIVCSKLPSASKFESWVFDEVLPSIRKNGGYISNQENMTPEQIVANALVVANNIIEAKNKELGQAHAKIKEDAPKVEFYNAVTESKDAIDIASVAKTLNFKGIGRNKLFEILRDNKVLQHNNQPYQRYIDRGFFRIIEQKFVKPTGDICINLKTVVYQQGVEFIRNLVKNIENNA